MKLEKSNHQEGIFTSWKNFASLIFALTNFSKCFFIKKLPNGFLDKVLQKTL